MEDVSYIDEKIVKLRKIYQKQHHVYDLLNDEVIIHGKKNRFIFSYLFEGKVKVLIPDDFQYMPTEIAKIRYINNYRPSVILTSLDYDENIGYYLFKKDKKQKFYDLDVYVEQIKEVIRRNAHETIFYEKGNIYGDKINGKWFEYKSFTLDEEVYNLKFITETDINLLSVGFNCRMRFFDEWKKIILKSWEYMEIMEGEMGEG